MNRKYPVIDMGRTGRNIKHIMQKRGMTVREVQDFLEKLKKMGKLLKVQEDCYKLKL